MKLIIVSGMSGSGKTVALHTLEDSGYYCIDNLPVMMLPQLVSKLANAEPGLYELVAVAIDARSGIETLNHFESMLDEVKTQPVEVETLFLTCDVTRLIKRFSETRRRHPLSRDGLPLTDAIELEKQWLNSVQNSADLSIDTSDLNVHELRQQIRRQWSADKSAEMSILVQSFGFKYGTPSDTDFIFDSRCLPNPHWEESLRHQDGRSADVADYLSRYSSVTEMQKDILEFLLKWIPRFQQENRSYMTISIGCTGGQHRSVYLAESIAADLKQQQIAVSLRHREISARL